MKHTIMAVMARREGETALTGRIEMDDASLSEVRSGGKRAARGAAGKMPFVAAVPSSPEGRPRTLKLAPVKGLRKREIARGVKRWLAPGAAVVADGLGCWSTLEEIACSNQTIGTGSGRQAARMAPLQMGEHDARITAVGTRNPFSTRVGAPGRQDFARSFAQLSRRDTVWL